MGTLACKVLRCRLGDTGVELGRRGVELVADDVGKGVPKPILIETQVNWYDRHIAACQYKDNSNDSLTSSFR
jgi:hypothetical protein